MFLESLNDFKQLCPNKPVECATACRVYVALLLEKNYVSINKCYDETLQVFYLRAKRLEQSDVIILPLLDTQELDLKVVYKLQDYETDNMRYIFKHFVLQMPKELSLRKQLEFFVKPNLERSLTVIAGFTYIRSLDTLKHLQTNLKCVLSVVVFRTAIHVGND